MGREKQKQFIRYFIHLLGQALRAKVYPFIRKSIMIDLQIPANEMDFALRLNKMCSMEAAGSHNK